MRRIGIFLIVSGSLMLGAIALIQTNQAFGLRAEPKKMTDIAHQATGEREEYRDKYLECLDEQHVISGYSGTLWPTWHSTNGSMMLNNGTK